MALQRGIHFRRAAYWALQRTIEAGAQGVEIIIRGKLTTDRARYEKYKAGYLPSVGEAVDRIVRSAVVDTQLKQGLFGIRVRLLPKNVSLPDKPTIRDVAVTPIPKEAAEPVAESNVIQEVAEVANNKES